MAYNGSGSFTVNGSYFPAVAGALIESAKYNGALNDIATGLSTAITKDGQTTITGNLPMSGFRHTGVGDGATRTDYASVGQAQDSSALWAGTAGGTANAITLTLAPAITAYAAGQSFTYKSGAAANTTAMTVAVSGLTTKAIQKSGAAVASGDHPANMWFRITYDGAAFQLEQIAPVSAAATTALTTALALKAPLASPTFTGVVDLTAAVLAGGTPIVFEGATPDAFETSVVVTDPTADRTITIPNADVDLTKVRAASTSVDGVVELLTNAELLTGTDTTRAATAAAMASLVTPGTNTTLSFPGGLKIFFAEVAGNVNVTGNVTIPVTFPTPFATAAYHVYPTIYTADSGVARELSVVTTSQSTTGATFYVWESGASTQASWYIYYIAIGKD